MGLDVFLEVDVDAEDTIVAGSAIEHEHLHQRAKARVADELARRAAACHYP